MKKLLVPLIFFLFYPYRLLAGQQLLPYRTPSFFGEPRIGKPWLFSVDVALGGGKAEESFNKDGDKTALFSPFGPEKVSYLTKGVQDAIIAKNPNSIINNLWSKVGDNFGLISFGGLFKVTDGSLSLVQNLERGFFLTGAFSVRTIKIKELSIRDDSDRTQIGTASLIDWKQLMSNFKSEMKKYAILLDEHEETGIGDLYLGGGWTYTYDETKFLDFIDSEIQLGFYFPTSPQQINRPLLPPHGYNGHFGVHLSSKILFGLYEWLNIGAHTRGTFFASKDRTVRLKTDKNQQGFLKLTTGNATVEQGSVWQVGTHVKADHAIWGLSFTVAYSYTWQDQTFLSRLSTTPSDSIINSDTQNEPWTLHTINTNIEYDFSLKEDELLPRISLIFDVPVGGTRSKKTRMILSNVGVDFTW